MNLLLSALVLAWGFIPPGVQHSHAGGDDSTHRHEVAHLDSHNRDSRSHNSHDHDSDDGHHEHAIQPDVSLRADSVVHLHWRFLGVEFSMPAPEQPVENGDDRGTLPSIVISVIDETVPTMRPGPSLGGVFRVAARTLSTDVVRDLEPVPRPPNLVTSIPLCDSARLERSGVLLA